MTADRGLEERLSLLIGKDPELLNAVLALIREERAKALEEAARGIEQLQPLDESGERFVQGFFAATDDAERMLEARALVMVRANQAYHRGYKHGVEETEAERGE